MQVIGYMNRKILQLVLAVLGLIPLLTGGLSLLLGAHAFNVIGGSIPSTAINNVVLDSEARFLGAIWFSIGVLLYWILPSIHQQTTLFRLLTGGIFLGGLGRLASAFLVGIPPVQFIAAIVLELIGMPLLIMWQSLISTSSSLIERSTL